MSRFVLTIGVLILPLAAAYAEPPKLDQYGDPLPPGAIARLGTMRWRVGTAAAIVRFLPDGTLLTISDDLLGQVWELSSGSELRHFDLRTAIPGSLPPGQAISVNVAMGRSMTLSDDGKRLIVVGADAYSHLFDLATGRYVRKVGPIPSAATIVALSRDGSLFADMQTIGGTPGGRIWDTTTEAPPRFLLKSGGESRFFPHHMSFSPDGSKLLQVGLEDDPNGPTRGEVAILRDLSQAGEPRRVVLLEGAVDLVGYPVVSSDHRAVAVPLRDKVVLVNPADGKEIATLEKAGDSSYRTYLFTPDGKALVGTAGLGLPLRVWEVSSGKLLRMFGEPPATPRHFNASVATISPDGKTLACSDGPVVSLVDLETGKLRNEIVGHTGSLRGAQFSADGKEVATRSTDGMILRWDPATGRELGRLAPPGQPPTCQLTPDGRWLVCGVDRANFNLRVFETKTMTEVGTIQAAEQLTNMTWGVSPDSRLVVVALSTGHSVRLFDIAACQFRTELVLPNAPPAPAPPPGGPAFPVTDLNRLTRRILFTDDGRLLGVVSEGFITVWDVATSRRIGQVSLAGVGSALRHAAIAPDGGTVAAETSGGVTVWELVTGSKRATIDAGAAPSGTGNAPILTTLPVAGGRAFVMSLAYSPDGRLLARAGEDRRIRVYDAWDGTELGTFEGHRGALTKVEFSHDGRRLVSASTDSTAIIWDAGPLREKLTRPRPVVEAGDVDALWSALGNADAGRAFDAMRKLVQDPARAVALCRERVKPAEPTDSQAIEKWITALDDAKFAAREKANQELAKLGERAATALRRATEAKSTQVRQSAKKLLDRLDQGTPTEEELRTRRAIEVLEEIGIASAEEVLKALAAGGQNALRTIQAEQALQRLHKK
jgi:WD40 repeat protein